MYFVIVHLQNISNSSNAFERVSSKCEAGENRESRSPRREFILRNIIGSDGQYHVSPCMAKYVF
jgi:hypothetical protein